MMIAALFLLFPAQAGEIEDLLRELDGESIVAREEAEARLRKRGPAALPALEKAKNSGNPEFRDRVRRIIVAIHDERVRHRVLGPVRRVHLSPEKRSFKEALREIDRLTGFETAVGDGVEDRPVTLRLSDRPYFEAVDLLCRAHGNARLEPLKRGGFRIEAGLPARAPTRYVGPFRVRIEYIKFRRLGLYWGGATSPGAWVGYSVLWQPNVRPYSGAGVVIDQATDDRGSEWVNDKKRQRNLESRNRPEPGKGTYTRSWIQYDRLPAIDATKLVRLKGSVFLTFPLSEPVFDFRPKDVGKRRNLGAYVVELSSVRVEEKSISVSFTTSRRDGSAMTSLQGFPFGSSQIRILDADGKDLPYRGAGGSLTKGATIWSRDARRVDGRPPATIRVQGLERWFWREVAFEFRDVSLPQW